MNTDMTPSDVARAMAEKSLHSVRRDNFGAARREREISRTFALIAIAEALEAIVNKETP